MAISRLLNSCATPPVSWPTASRRCERRRTSSASKRAVTSCSVVKASVSWPSWPSTRLAFTSRSMAGPVSGRSISSSRGTGSPARARAHGSSLRVSSRVPRYIWGQLAGSIRPCIGKPNSRRASWLTKYGWPSGWCTTTPTGIWSRISPSCRRCSSSAVLTRASSPVRASTRLASEAFIPASACRRSTRTRAAANMARATASASASPCGIAVQLPLSPRVRAACAIASIGLAMPRATRTAPSRPRTIAADPNQISRKVDCRPAAAIAARGDATATIQCDLSDRLYATTTWVPSIAVPSRTPSRLWARLSRRRAPAGRPTKRCGSWVRATSVPAVSRMLETHPAGSGSRSSNACIRLTGITS